ncbi:unnamed protein product [Malus baccata var. baccata]
MSSLGGIVVILSSFLCVFLVFVLIKIVHKLWWTPTRIQKMMKAQGIKGPPYRLIHGNTKEISDMKKEVMRRPKNLSHDIVSVVVPHIHSLLNPTPIFSYYSYFFTYNIRKNYLQWHGSLAQLVITEPELCKEIMSNKDKAYPKRDPTTFVKKLLGDGLVTTTESEKWEKLRKLATHAFHGECLKIMFPDMVASAETMLERWRNNEEKEMEMFEEFRLFTSEVISRTAFGSSYLEGQNIFEMLMKLAFLVSKNALTVRIPGISGEEASFGSDFFGLLLKAHHDASDDQRISVDDLVDECKTFYFAGQETTNTSLGWTVFLLALHTNWQEEARKEFIELFGKQAPNLDGFAKMKTMSMILNESLRLYPPFASFGRKVEREVRLGNVSVPANVELIVSNLSFHHDPRIWGEDTQLFKPERFAEGIAKATNNNIGAFVPFGIGPRSCVGLNFAINEAKIVLSMILQRYSFTLSPGYVHLPTQYVTVRPQHGVQVMLHSL